MEPIVEQIPIRIDEDGRMRVGTTQVLLDLVVLSFWQGRNPEEISSQYSTLSLDEIYLAIGYYLRHRADVDAYIDKQQKQADALYDQYKTQHSPHLIRERLERRLANKKAAS